jgi:hypothetical protein
MPGLQAIQDWLKPSTIEAIQSATLATCEVLDPESIPIYPLTPSRELPFEGCSLLKDLLLDPRSWFFAKKRCLPHWIAQLKLQGQQFSVRVEVDTCDGWVITAPQQRTGGFFDPVRDQVRAIIKNTFPEFASRDRRSMWRNGAIRELKSKASRGAQS